ncbi:RHS repeat-associated core domain protein [Saprospira grandis DSM 2844]|uniref:RHS repeat-associated core domain protein n=2 Tax=Saprospira grandis DSM 2844 TaxID=694433 RepID=J0P9M4_9BACT|nr:RHS repeat-associated core domain-containing protein [Saprospira grandis]EJF54302.1 RHS repeat-associated core domain protein [Saprospira grandis DSM 2844]
MPGRKFVSGEGYRFGFNGKEDDRDWGTQNIQDYGFRLYNPSIGKFLSVDPLAKSFPWNSCYAFAEGDVVRSVDLDGLEKEFYYTMDKGQKPILKSVSYGDSPMDSEGNREVHVVDYFDDLGYKLGQAVHHSVDELESYDHDEQFGNRIRPMASGRIDPVDDPFTGALGGGLGLIDDLVAHAVGKITAKVGAKLLSKTLLKTSPKLPDQVVGAAKKGFNSKKTGKKASNKLRPDKSAEGDHTTFKRDDYGKVFKYETYEKTRTGHYNPIKRYDGGKPNGDPGNTHANGKGVPIPTPHVQGKGIPEGVRPPEPWEIPK